jgi:hypothetical protein
MHDSLRARAADRRLGVVVALVSVAAGLAAIGARTLAAFTGGGADMAHHYALVYWFTHHWTPPTADNSDMASMTDYPPAAHILAAQVGRLVDSPFRGMQLVAIAAVVSIWCAVAALITMLPNPRRWVALAALAGVLLLSTSAGPLEIQPHGFEIIGNFFFAQLVGQAFVWWAAWFSVRRQISERSWISTALPIAVAAVLSTTVHVLPAVELLLVVGCLAAAELLDRWRTGEVTLRSAALPIGLPAVTAVAVVLSPGFRAMRVLSENDGSLDVPYLGGVASYVGVALVVTVVSLGFLLAPAVRGEPATAAVVRGLGFVGLAVAVPCLLQAALLAGSEGSPYAVKKYIFGLETVLLVDACVAAAMLVPAGARTSSAGRPAWRVAATAALAVTATLVVFSYKGSGYPISRITTLERQVVAAATSEREDASDYKYAVALPGSDPVIDYMFSISVLAAPLNRAIDELLVPLLRGDLLQPEHTSGELLTAGESPYDSEGCRRAGDGGPVVVVDAACWWSATRACRAVNHLGQAGLVVDPRLQGFSLAEPTGRWTEGRHASFRCALTDDDRRGVITIEVDGTAFLPAGVSRQRVTLAAGDRRNAVALTRRNPHAVLRLVVPIPASRWLALTLTLPDAVSPQAAGVSADARELALFVSQIRIG